MKKFLWIITLSPFLAMGCALYPAGAGPGQGL